MAFCGYKYKYHLNMSHSINTENPRVGLHYHTLEITLYIQEQQTAENTFVPYEHIEREVEQYFAEYEGVFFNEIELFTKIPTTIEHVGDIFYTALKKKLKKVGYNLVRLEISGISEALPTSYVITGFLKRGYAELEADTSAKRLKQFIQASLPYVKQQQKAADLEEEQRQFALSELSELGKEEPQEVFESAEPKAAEQMFEAEPKAAEQAVEELPEMPQAEEETVQIVEELPETPRAEKEAVQAVEELPETFQAGEEVLEAAQEEDREAFFEQEEEEDDESSTWSGWSGWDEELPIEQVPRVRRGVWAARARIAAVIVILFAASAGVSVLFTKRGDFPFGQDIYLFFGRTEYLFEQLKLGNYIPMYMEEWFNGSQLFLKFPPLPYYLLAFIRAFTGDMPAAYGYYIGGCFFIGLVGWTLLGKRWKNLLHGLLAGLLWLFMPGILEIYAYYGNPSFLLMIALLPYMLLAVEKSCEFGRVRDYMLLGTLFFSAVLTESVFAFILLIGLTVYGLLYGFRPGRRIHTVWMVFLSAIGITATGPWLFFAIKNGSLDMIAGFNESFPISILLVLFILCGIIFGKKRSRIACCLALFFWALSACNGLSFVQELPFSEYICHFWFVVAAAGFLLLAFIQLEEQNLIVTIVFCVLLLASGVLQSNDFIFRQKDEKNFAGHYSEIEENGLKEAVDQTDNRLLYLDLEGDEGFLQYYASTQKKRIGGNYRMEEQQPEISAAILQIEQAVSKGYYTYVFDRALEGGNDTVVIGKKAFSEKDEGQRQKLLDSAEKLQYDLMAENEKLFIFHREGLADSGIVSQYDSIAIGSGAQTAAMAFPVLEEGVSERIEDYPLEELKKYKKILLTGLSENAKKQAEKTIEELEHTGVEVYVDTKEAGGEESLAGIGSFLGVEEGAVPHRTPVDVAWDFTDNHIVFTSEHDGVNTTWAYQSSFAEGQKLKNQNHYLVVGKGETEVFLDYGKKWYVIWFTGLAAVLFAIWQFVSERKRDVLRAEEEEAERKAQLLEQRNAKNKENVNSWRSWKVWKKLEQWNPTKNWKVVQKWKHRKRSKAEENAEGVEHETEEA